LSPVQSKDRNKAPWKSKTTKSKTQFINITLILLLYLKIAIPSIPISWVLDKHLFYLSLYNTFKPLCYARSPCLL